MEVKEVTPKLQKQCNCKHSRCLKLYCECFASGVYCDGCNCANCHNNVEYEAPRREAVEATLERNPNAFRPKIFSSPHAPRSNREESWDGMVLAKHNKGCNCKKSGCLKKYCECFQAGILCSENCKCLDCKNFEGSDERQALFHGDHTSSLAYIQQAANAAITGAVGSSGFGSPPVSKKRKGQDLVFTHSQKDPSALRPPHSSQARVSSHSSLPSLLHRSSSNGAFAPKITYRSLLSDIIQPHDLRELCSVLVVLSKETGRELGGERSPPRPSNEVSANGSGEEAANEVSTSGSGQEADTWNGNGRVMSPGTLALMCDEQDALFAATAVTSSDPGDAGTNTEAYAEQERVVLTRFRDCLNRLITFGEIKEAKSSSMAKADARGHVASRSSSPTANGAP